jgi:type IV secretion system protein VirB10
MARISAPLGPDDVGEPIDAPTGGHAFSTKPVIEGATRAISQRGLMIGAGLALVLMLGLLDGMNIIHVDLGFDRLFAHPAANATPQPAITRPPLVGSTPSADTDGALASILSATPVPASPTPVPAPVTPAPRGTIALPPLAAAPLRLAENRVPDTLDTNGPALPYEPLIREAIDRGSPAVTRAVSPATSGSAPAPSTPDPGGSEIAPSIAIAMAMQSSGGGNAPAGAAVAPSATVAPAAAPTVPPALVQQHSAVDFGARAGQPGGYLDATRAPAVSRYEIWAGRFLRVELDTAIIVDVPGAVTAHLIEPVKDSATGTVVLMPERTELIGTYNASISSGASRIQIAWKQATFPDGSTLALADMAAADRNGWSGTSADVNNHTGAIIGTTLLTSAVAAVTALADPSTSVNGIAVQTPGQAAGQSILQTGQQYVATKVNQPPTLSVDHTIVLPPYAPLPAQDEAR